jgi:hypothetical protein
MAVTPRGQLSSTLGEHRPLADVVNTWRAHEGGHETAPEHPRSRWHSHHSHHAPHHTSVRANQGLSAGHGQEHDEQELQLDIAPRVSGRVLTSIRRLDRFLGGFEPGSITLLTSQSEFLFNLVARIIVNTVKNSQKDVVYIDGGNSLDPYLLTAACRLFRVNADEVLSRVQVARAFTVFQMDTLIVQNLERILSQHRPQLVFVSCVSELYLDRDVNWYEAKTLFGSDLQKLQRLAAKYNVTTLLTNFGRDKSIHRFELDRMLRKGIPQRHRLSIKVPARTKLRFVRGTGEFMDYFPLPAYQWTLDDFYPGGDVCG